MQTAMPFVDCQMGSNEGVHDFDMVQQPPPVNVPPLQQTIHHQVQQEQSRPPQEISSNSNAAPTSGIFDSTLGYLTPHCVAFQWIRRNYTFENDHNLLTSKQEVYDRYVDECVKSGKTYINNADFGKVAKTAFPALVSRRLGQRGSTRYYYAGLKMIRQTGNESQQSPTTTTDELEKATTALVCEWASKMLGHEFNKIPELAEFLVKNAFVNLRSRASFLLVEAMEKNNSAQKLSPPGRVSLSSHRSVQLQLQQKLQQKRLLRNAAVLNPSNTSAFQQVATPGDSSKNPQLLNGISVPMATTDDNSLSFSASMPSLQQPAPAKPSSEGDSSDDSLDCLLHVLDNNVMKPIVPETETRDADRTPMQVNCSLDESTVAEVMSYLDKSPAFKSPSTPLRCPRTKRHSASEMNGPCMKAARSANATPRDVARPCEPVGAQFTRSASCIPFTQQVVYPVRPSTTSPQHRTERQSNATPVFALQRLSLATPVSELDSPKVVTFEGVQGDLNSQKELVLDSADLKNNNSQSHASEDLCGALPPLSEIDDLPFPESPYSSEVSAIFNQDQFLAARNLNSLLSSDF